MIFMAGARRGSGWAADDLLDDVGAPARPVGHDQLAVLDLERMGQQVALPGHVVEVDLEDLDVRAPPRTAGR